MSKRSPICDGRSKCRGRRDGEEGGVVIRLPEPERARDTMRIYEYGRVVWWADFCPCCGRPLRVPEPGESAR